MMKLDWGYSPIQEQSINVERGIEKITSVIDDQVKRKVEGDIEFNKQQQDILAKTSGRYQEEVFAEIEKQKQEIKNLGKVNWNSKELITARGNAMSNLTKMSQKANFITANAAEWQKLIKEGKYNKQDEMMSALSTEMNKPLSEINIGTIDAIMSSPAYKNWEAWGRDQVAEYMKHTTSSPVYNRLENGMYILANFKFSPSFWKLSDKMGKDGHQKFEFIGQSVVDRLLEDPGFKSFAETLYETPKKYVDENGVVREKGPAITKANGEGDSYNQLVREEAIKWVSALTSPEYQKVATDEKTVLQPRASSYNGKLDENQVQQGHITNVTNLTESLYAGHDTGVTNLITQIGGDTFTIAKKGADGHTDYLYSKTRNNLIRRSELDSVPIKDRAGYKEFEGYAYRIDESRPTKPDGAVESMMGESVGFQKYTGVGGDQSKPNYSWAVFEGGGDLFKNKNKIRNFVQGIYDKAYGKGSHASIPVYVVEGSNQTGAGTNIKKENRTFKSLDSAVDAAMSNPKYAGANREDVKKFIEAKVKEGVIIIN